MNKLRQFIAPHKVKEDLKQVSQTVPAPARSNPRRTLAPGPSTSSSSVAATLLTEDDFNQILEEVTNHLEALGYIGSPLILQIPQLQYQKTCLFLLEKIKGKKIKKGSRNVNFILRSAGKYGIPVISTTHFQTPYAEPQWPHVFPFLQKLSEHAIRTVFPPAPPQPETNPIREPTPERLSPPQSNEEDVDPIREPTPERLNTPETNEEEVKPIREPTPEPSKPPESDQDEEEPESARKPRLARRWTVVGNSSSNQEPPRCSNIGDTIFKDSTGALLPLTKDGFPNLNFKVSKDWVKWQCETCEGVIPKWVSSRDFGVKLNNISKIFYKHYDEMYPSETEH